MQISYLGHSSFRIKTKEATIVTDPFSKSIGSSFSKQTADIVTVSHQHDDHNNLAGIKNEERFVIDAPGEYEVKEVMITGYKSYHDNVKGEDRGGNTIFTYEVEELVLCHLGDLGHTLQNLMIKQLENTDILLIPVGGVFTIGPKMAAKIVRSLEPSIVIPMHYKREGLSDFFATLKTKEPFLNELGIEAKKEDKLTISQATLPGETKVVIFD